MAHFDELHHWAERHGWVTRNACQVFADRMRREAAEVRARVETGEYGPGVLQAARAFEEAADTTEAAGKELGRIMDGPDDDEEGTTT